jgi:hypothetical protein
MSQILPLISEHNKYYDYDFVMDPPVQHKGGGPFLGGGRGGHLGPLAKLVKLPVKQPHGGGGTWDLYLEVRGVGNSFVQKSRFTRTGVSSTTSASYIQMSPRIYFVMNIVNVNDIFHISYISYILKILNIVDIANMIYILNTSSFT